jgi:hypothetical protein
MAEFEPRVGSLVVSHEPLRRSPGATRPRAGRNPGVRAEICLDYVVHQRESLTAPGSSTKRSPPSLQRTPMSHSWRARIPDSPRQPQDSPPNWYAIVCPTHFALGSASSFEPNQNSSSAAGRRSAWPRRVCSQGLARALLNLLLGQRHGDLRLQGARLLSLVG